MTLRVHPDEIVAKGTSPLLRIHPSWERVRLSEIGVVQNGCAFSSSGFGSSGDMPLIRIRDVGKGTTATWYSGSFDARYVVEPGSLIVGMDGDFRVEEWRGAPALLNQRVCKVTVRRPDLYSEKFLRWALPGYLDAVHRETSSVTVKHLSSETVKQLPLPLPPRAEQDRIVAAIEEQFSRLDVGVATLQRVMRDLKRMRSGLLRAAADGRLTAHWRSHCSDQEPAAELVKRLIDQSREVRRNRRKARQPLNTDRFPTLPEGWVYTQIEPLLSADRPGMKTGPFGSLLKKHEHCPEGVPVLGIENIEPMQFSPGSRIHISPSKAADLSSYDVRPGDLLISRSGTVGEVCVVPQGIGEARFSTNLMRVVLAPGGMLAEFVALLFNGSPMVLAQVSDLCKGTTRDFLNQTILSSIVLPLPPLAEQREILARLDERLLSVASMESQVVLLLRKAPALRRSILNDAFSGTLVPQDPSDEPALPLLQRIARERTSTTDDGPGNRQRRRKVIA